MFRMSILYISALVSFAVASTFTSCAGGACFALNIPATTASTGAGDIYMQISGPTSMSWIGLGQGGSMSGANIFMIYANAAGTNVTLSPRSGIGNQQPTSPSAAKVALLAGSGISNGLMIANFKCSNCNSWSGGSMNLAGGNTGSTTKWIFAYRTGSSVSSNDVSVNLDVHNYGKMVGVGLAAATGGDSSAFQNNVVIASTPTASTLSASTPTASNSAFPPSSTSSASADTESSSESEGNSLENKVLMAHAIGGAVAFVLLFPLGAISIRILSFPGLVWFHAGWMIFTYLAVLASMGLGVWVAVTTEQLSAYHSIIGLVVVGCLIIQPITGLLHHRLFKRGGRPNAATYPHVWWGRVIVTLGIINGGLGLQLAENTHNGEIAYGVVAGFMWLAWMGVIVFAFLRSRSATGDETKGHEAERKKSAGAEPASL